MELQAAGSASATKAPRGIKGRPGIVLAMLTFVYVAQKAGFVVDSYEDEAVGVMTKNERGATHWVSLVTLHPKIVYGGAKRPTDAEEEQLHHEAHEQCFIANSVKTEISVKR